MSELNKIRLNKVIREFNISLERIVEFLSSNGHEIEPRPTTKISQNQYDLLVSEFSSDRSSKVESHDSLLNIKKQVDKKLFDKNYYSIQVFSGSYKLADSISTFVTEKYTLDSTFFYFETPNYKVRVGKYRSKIIAEKKLREIKKTFKSAFVFKPKSK